MIATINSQLPTLGRTKDFGGPRYPSIIGLFDTDTTVSASLRRLISMLSQKLNIAFQHWNFLVGM